MVLGDCCSGLGRARDERVDADGRRVLFDVLSEVEPTHSLIESRSGSVRYFKIELSNT